MQKKILPLFIFTFFLIRLTSLLFQQSLIINVVSSLLLLVFIITLFKNQTLALQLLLAELFLAGAGHFFEFFSLSLRTWFLVLFLLFYFVKQIRQHSLKSLIFNLQSSAFAKAAADKSILILFAITLFLTISLGISNGHGLKSTIQDAIPFLYFFLIFPLRNFLQKQENKQFLFQLIPAFIISSAIFALLTFTLFSANLVHLHEPFYNWFRDFAMGKITDLHNGFFRIVLPEHLLIIPIILLLLSQLFSYKKISTSNSKISNFQFPISNYLILILNLVLILILNFSRAYFLGLVIGILVLKLRHNFKRWLLISTSLITALLITYITIFFISSRGQSLGLEQFGIRLTSIAAPQTEESSATRMLILPVALQMIKTHPLFGTGFGATVTFLNTFNNQIVTTKQFDWGYLEMAVEMGLVGLLIYLNLISMLGYKLYQQNTNVDWEIGFLSAIMALLVINITSPALFHVFGVVVIVFGGVIVINHLIK